MTLDPNAQAVLEALGAASTALATNMPENAKYVFVLVVATTDVDDAADEVRIATNMPPAMAQEFLATMVRTRGKPEPIIVKRSH